MSTCIEDLFDYEFDKKCSKCGIVKMKTDFYSEIDTQRWKNDCIQSRSSKNKEWEYKNQEKTKIYLKQYFQQNKDKIYEFQKQHEKSGKKSEITFRFACNFISRFNKDFKSENAGKINEKFNLLGCSQSFLRNWKIHQFFVDTIPKKHGTVW